MFFTYSQNNSGGSFHLDKDLSEFVIIEANSGIEADNKAEDIGIYFNGVAFGSDCACCGDRWYAQARSTGDVEPQIYGERVEDSAYPSVIHFANGKIATLTTSSR